MELTMVCSVYFLSSSTKINKMGTLLLQEKQPLHGWQVSQFQLVFPDLLEDMIYLGDDIITSFDVIVEWPMETVRSSVQELYTLLRSYLCYGVVGLFSWNVQLVVTHWT